MQIIYIHPEGYQKRYSEIVIPVGIIGVINNLLELGYDITGLNIPLEKKINPSFDVDNWLNKRLYDVYLVDLHWYIYAYNAIELTQKIKRINPKSIIILGGITASQFNFEIMKDYKSVDYIISGDSEYCYIELLDAIKGKSSDYGKIHNLTYRDGRTIKSNSVECVCYKYLDRFNYSKFDWLNNWRKFLIYQAHQEVGMFEEKESKLAWIPIARGCMHDCSYCGGNREYFRKVFNYETCYIRDIDSVIEDMKNLQNIGVDKVGVTHDLSMFGKYYWRELFKKMKLNGIHLSCFHYCYQLPSVEFIRNFNEVFIQNGSVIGIPVVTGDEKIRRLNGKNFRNKDLFKVLDTLKGCGTVVSLYFMDNAVKCGDNTFDATKKIIEEIIDRYSYDMKVEIGYGFELLQPASKIYRGEYQAEGVSPIWSTFNDIYTRLSPEFLNILHKEKNIDLILGHTAEDTNILRRYKYFNELIKEKKLNYIKEA